MIVMRPAPVKNAGPPRLKWASVSGDRLQAGEKHASVHPSLRTGKPMLTSLLMYCYSGVPALCLLLH